MIGTIRKHSAWLWWLVAGLTIISFVIFMGQGGTRYGARGGALGVIYDKPVTPETLDAAKREFTIYYWRQTGEFPGKNPNFSQTDLEKESYVRLMLTTKAKLLGIYVSEDAQVAVAKEFLSTLSRGKPVSMSEFVEKVLRPEGLTVADFQRYVADDLMIEQLIQSLGLPGSFVSPQEASQLYDRENQDYSAQAVFFSASNYLSQVTATPAAVSQFYTNYMAAYRLPDRVQVNYVKYDLSNFTASAEQKLGGKTNIAAQAEAAFAEHGLDAVPGAKTPEEAEAKIRDFLLRQEEVKEAEEQALQFVRPLFAMDPPLPDNLVQLAKKNGLAVHTTAPFSEADAPAEFPASGDLVKAMLALNADSPFIQRPVVGPDAVYVIGLAKQLPSVIQSFSDIHDRVVEDYKNYLATIKARATGTNFYVSAAVQMATGKTFAQAALAAGLAPVALTPFSLNSKEISEAEGHADIKQIQNAAYLTKVGHVSQFEPSEDGGFVLYVHSLLPVDEAAKKTEFPAFLAQMRRSRESEAFNLWVNAEASRQLANIPEFQALMSGKSPRSP